MFRQVLCCLLMMSLCLPAVAGGMGSSVQDAAHTALANSQAAHDAATDVAVTDAATDSGSDCHQEEVLSVFNHDRTHSTEHNAHDCCDIESTDCERPCHQAHTFSALALTQTREALSFRPVREHLQIVVAATPAHKNQPDRPPRFVS